MMPASEGRAIACSLTWQKNARPPGMFSALKYTLIFAQVKETLIFFFTKSAL